jgi:hypothetical protein
MLADEYVTVKDVVSRDVASIKRSRRRPSRSTRIGGTMVGCRARSRRSTSSFKPASGAISSRRRPSLVHRFHETNHMHGIHFS